MSRKIIFQVVWLFAVMTSSAFANPDSVVVPGDLRITGSGSGLVFPDGSIQYQATVQGPPGPQGPKGDPGSSVTIPQDALKSICDLYATYNPTNIPLPSFCPTADCVVSDWSAWSACTEVCMGGTQYRTRRVVLPAYNGGSACPALTETQACNTQPCPLGNIIFVSSEKYTAGLGGLIGADSKCQTLASGAGLTGTFKAWLSDSNMSATSRLTHSTIPYVRTDGRLIAYNWDGLVSGTLLSTISCDENVLCDIGVSGDESVWTNTKYDGSSNGSSCKDWSDSTIFGLSDESKTGSTNSINTGWTYSANASNGCMDLYTNRLYCIQQSE